ncbi:MAG: hypothetical protein M0020_02595 [Actinomycetota bacterium]|nr:hypothetical protein [Actinomycetota bacterium]
MTARRRATSVVSVAAATAASLVVATVVLVTSPRPAYPYPYGTVTLVGHGWGHGRGMGQWGALGYALSGTGYEEILSHYYGGTSPGTSSDLPIRVVLQEVDNENFAVTSAAAFSVAGIAFAGGTAARFVYLGTPGQWAVDQGASCTPGSGTAGGWTQVATATDPTAVPADESPSATEADVLQLCLPGGNKWLRGTIQAYDDNGQPRAVNTLPLELYLQGVVPAESPAYWGQLGTSGPQGQAWGFQELEAQAVAARSYAVSGMGQYGYADICDEVCQAYGGVGAESPLADLAIHDTAGQVRVFASGSVARTEYSASTGGFTAGGTFPAVPDLGDSVCVPGACNPNHIWRVQIAVGAIEAAYPQIGTLDTVTVTGRNGYGDLGGRVESMTVRGSSGSDTVSGAQFAATFNLRSNWFSVTSEPSGGVGGYWVVDAQGSVEAFGDARSFGSLAGARLSSAIVGIVATSDGGGYWLVGADGSVDAFGDAGSFGSLAGARLSSAIVAMAATPDGGGYWLVAADGSVYAFGDARFAGSLPRRGVQSGSVVGIAAGPSDAGYLIATSGGSVYAFGDARSFGSLSAAASSPPIVCVATAPNERGYWLLAADGTVYSFGAVPNVGGFSRAGLVASARALVPTRTGLGYLVLSAVGSVEDFGDAPQFGDPTMDPTAVSGTIVGIATSP